MAAVTQITSYKQFQELLSSTTYVITDFYADWCGPCRTIAPFYGQLAASNAAAGKLAFAKVNVDTQQQIATTYGVTAMPTFIVFKNGKSTQAIRGANPPALKSTVDTINAQLKKDAAAKKAEEAAAAAQMPEENKQEENFVRGGYAMTAGNSWKMSL